MPVPSLLWGKREDSVEEAGGGEMCSLSQSLVSLSQTGLLLQAADTGAILKICHPQLHLTI